MTDTKRFDENGAEIGPSFEHPVAATPKTDAAEIRVDVGRAGDAMYVVPGYFARELEREVARLRADLTVKEGDINHFSNASAQLRERVRDLLEIEDARIATGAFKPNDEARRRIEAARLAIIPMNGSDAKAKHGMLASGSHETLCKICGETLMHENHIFEFTGSDAK